MKTCISISIIILFTQNIRAQETARKEFLFQNPGTTEPVIIEPGRAVKIWFRVPEASVKGTVLSFTDSSLTLSLRQEPHFRIVLFRSVSKITVVATAHKKYTAWITLKSGKIVNGRLIGSTKDSLSLQNTKDLQITCVAALDIKSIRIRKRGAISKGLGIGAGAGAILGAIIGYSSFSRADCSTSSSLFCGLDDPFVQVYDMLTGALIGAVAGSLTGALIGSGTGKEFKIEGAQARFDLFANEFTDQGLQPGSKK